MVSLNVNQFHHLATSETTADFTLPVHQIIGETQTENFDVSLKISFIRTSTYECACNDGYFGDGFVCTLERNCNNIPELCDVNAICASTSNGWKCVCNQGEHRNEFKIIKLEVTMDTKKLNQVAIITADAPKNPYKPCQPKTPFVWRYLKFGNKLFVAGSLLYYTHVHGAWGTPEQSLEFIAKLSDHLQVFTPYHIAALIWPEQ